MHFLPPSVPCMQLSPKRLLFSSSILLRKRCRDFISSAALQSLSVFKKTICIALIFQLALPPSFVKASDSDEEEYKPRPPSPHFLNDPRLPRATAASSGTSIISSSSAIASSSAGIGIGAMPEGDAATVVAPQASSLTQRLKALYQSQHTLPKLIDDERLPEHHLSTHYVDLQVLLKEESRQGAAAYDSVLGEKAPIDLNDIFNQVDKDHPEVSRILFLGGAGVGKTTLLHYLSYRWAQDGKEALWEDKFDYVFRVRLKELLDDGWAKYYGGGNFERDPLSCFLHHCLSVESSLISAQDIMEIKNKDRVLLLLDGYDEISHLPRNNRDYRTVMDGVFQYKHVLMSSRPNAIGREVGAKFERRIETRGFGREQVRHYIDLHFQDVEEAEPTIATPAAASMMSTDKPKEEKKSKLGKDLKQFLSRNAQIMEMCAVPINLALICLMWRDSTISKKLSSHIDVNIGQLYHDVVLWLGKRYFEKFEQRDPLNIMPENIFQSEEVQFLRRVAYDSFVDTGKLVTSKVIRDNLGILNLEKIIKYGLLKPEGDGQDITKLNHQFAHLTFQEYLTADLLREQLLTEDKAQLQKTAQFIGEHRNEPKYLMTLKFLAGMVSDEEGRGAQVASSSSRAPSSLLRRFWETVTCNVDGVLELGVETKVKTLMHLLGQSKIRGELPSGLPNREKIIDFVDGIILKNIAQWEQEIIQSGYLSRALVKRVQLLVTQAGVPSASEVLEAKKQADKSQQLSVSTQQESEEKKEEKEKASSQKTINVQQLKAALEIMTSLADRPEFKGRRVVVKQLMAILSNSPDWKIKKFSIQKLGQLMDEEMLTKRALRQKILNTLTTFFRDDNLGNVMKDTLVKLAKISPTGASEVLSLLDPLFEIIDFDAQRAAREILCEIVQAVPDIAPQALKLVFSFFKRNNAIFTSDELNEILLLIIKTVPSIAPKALDCLPPLLKDEKGYNIKRNAARNLVKIVKTFPSVAPKAWPLLSPLLKDEDEYVRRIGVKGLGLIVTAIPSLAQEASNSVRSLLEDQNKDVRKSAVESLGAIATADPSIAGQVLASLAPFLKKKGWDIRNAAFESFHQTLKIAPSIAHQAFGLLTRLLEDQNKDVRKSAVENIGLIVEADPNKAPEALALLSPILKEGDKHVRGVEAWNFPTAIYEDWEALPPRIKDRYKEAAFKSLWVVIKVAPNVTLEAFNLLLTLLENPDEDVKQAAAWSLPFDKATFYLGHENKNIRKGVETSLLSQLKNKKEGVVITHELIPALLRIVNETMDTEEDKARALNKVAQKVLQTRLDKIDEEGLQWITSHFDELPECLETKSFLAALYRKVLSEGELTLISEDFIILCIRYGLTTSATREGKIIFDGTTYQLSKSSKKHLEAIMGEAIRQPDDLLAAQYQTHQPLFPNTDSGILVAASDIPDVRSLTDRASLTAGKGFLTLLSDVSSGEDKLILFERRSHFGNHIAYTFNSQGKRLADKDVHPALADRLMREEFFGSADASTYWARSVVLETEQIRSFMRWQETYQPPLSSSAKGFMSFVNTLLNAHPPVEERKEKTDSVSTASSSIVAAPPSPKIPSGYPISRLDLLGIDPNSGEATSIKQGKQLNEHAQQLKKHETWLKKHDEELAIHEKALLDGEVFKKADIAQDLRDLTDNSPQLRLYWRTFYWTLQNLFDAYRGLSTKTIASDALGRDSAQQSLKVKGANAFVNYGVKLGQALPFVGGAIGTLQGIVSNIYKTVKNNALKDEAATITKIIQEKADSVEGIGLFLAKTALLMTEKKKPEILTPRPCRSPNEGIMGKIKSLGNTLEERSKNILKNLRLIPQVNLPEDPTVRMALADATALMSYLFTHYEDILANEAPFDQQLEDLIKKEILSAQGKKAGF